MSRYESSRPEMETPEYKAFRNKVFSMDNYTCVLCGSKGNHLEAHHIIRWADNEDKRYLVSNGVTLCTGCHDMVTGNEPKFVDHFREIVEKRIEKYRAKVRGNKPKTEKAGKWKNWNPRNWRCRY